MATLYNKETHELVTLLVQHVLGRHPDGVNTILHNADASRLHCVIIWDGEYWKLKDTSANGTFINGVKVAPNIYRALRQGDKVNFGNTHSDTWELLDEDAPRSLLLPVTAGLPTIILEDLIALPSERSPEVILYLSVDGQWICENQRGFSILNSGDLVGTNKEVWRFFSATPSTRTDTFERHSAISTKNISFLFNVSQNEEHVSLAIKVDQQSINLGERRHHYLLLLLARKRLSDRTAGLRKSEQGWVNKDSLSKMLGVSEYHINIQIFRFRKQIIGALPESTVLHQTIERRTGELRFGHEEIEIHGGLDVIDHKVENL